MRVVGKFVARAVLVCSLLCGAMCRPAGAMQLSAVPGEQRPEDVAAIRAHLDKIFQGFIHQEPAALRAGHSTDWRGFLEGSRKIGKGIEQYMQATDGAMKSPVHMTGYKILDLDVVFYGDVALVPYICEVEGGSGDQSFKEKLRILDVFAKLNGDWIQVATDTTEHPDQMEADQSEMETLPPQAKKNLLDAREGVWRDWFANNRAHLEVSIPAEAIAIEAGVENFEHRDDILAGAKGFADSGSKLVRLEFPQTEIQAYGNTAILYSKFVLATEKGGKQTEQSGRATEMFVYRGQGWVNTGWHIDPGK